MSGVSTGFAFWSETMDRVYQQNSSPMFSKGSRKRMLPMRAKEEVAVLVSTLLSKLSNEWGDRLGFTTRQVAELCFGLSYLSGNLEPQ